MNCCLCHKKEHCRKMCHKHYAMFRKWGDPFYTERKYKWKDSFCGCGQPVSAKGLCFNHYNQEYRNKNPEVVLKSLTKYMGKLGGSFNMKGYRYIYELRLWSMLIRKMDNYMCKLCDSTTYIQAHHILPKAEFPELSLDLDNGVTLCRDCHSETHGFKCY